MNIGNWMTDEQMSLIKDRRMRKTNKNILRRKSQLFSQVAPNTPHHSDADDDAGVDGNGHSISMSNSTSNGGGKKARSPSPQPNPPAAHLIQASPPNPGGVLKTRLAISSMISYTLDRILTPEMMRAMIILYVGPTARPDFSTDYLLSPLLAPDALLARFPKTYFLTGERDPLVDDTVIMAGRIRRAKWGAWLKQRQHGEGRGGEFREEDHVEVDLVEGVSHGFLQFSGVWPEGWRYIYRVATWIGEGFERGEKRREGKVAEGEGRLVNGAEEEGRRHHRR
jgi:hypothetical protein